MVCKFKKIIYGQYRIKTVNHLLYLLQLPLYRCIVETINILCCISTVFYARLKQTTPYSCLKSLSTLSPGLNIPLYYNLCLSKPSMPPPPVPTLRQRPTAKRQTPASRHPDTHPRDHQPHDTQTPPLCTETPAQPPTKPAHRTPDVKFFRAARPLQWREAANNRRWASRPGFDVLQLSVTLCICVCVYVQVR